MSEFIESHRIRSQADVSSLARLGAVARSAAARAWAHAEHVLTAPTRDSAPHQRRVTRSFIPQIGTPLVMPLQHAQTFAELQTDEALLIDPVTDEPEAA